MKKDDRSRPGSREASPARTGGAREDILANSPAVKALLSRRRRELTEASDVQLTPAASGDASGGGPTTAGGGYGAPTPANGAAEPLDGGVDFEGVAAVGGDGAGAKRIIKGLLSGSAGGGFSPTEKVGDGEGEVSNGDGTSDEDSDAGEGSLAESAGDVPEDEGTSGGKAGRERARATSSGGGEVGG